MQKTPAVFALLNLLASVGPVSAACRSNPPNQAHSTFPPLIGKLVYHSYVRLDDGSGQIFLLDFKTSTLTQLSQPSWGIIDPINPVLSPDGVWVAFMGKKNDVWRIFMYRLDGAIGPIDLTGAGLKSQDPKFSLDGAKLIFKQDNDIKLAHILFTNGIPSLGPAQNITQDGATVEDSMPFLSPDSSIAYFSTGAGASSALRYKSATSGGASLPFDNATGRATYYPIVRSDGAVFYVKWKDAASRLDQIQIKSSPSATPILSPINDCISNNSDPAPVNGTNYVFFSSTTAGGYQLYLGEVASGRRWTLTPFGVNADTTKAKLGAYYR